MKAGEWESKDGAYYRWHKDDDGEYSIEVRSGRNYGNRNLDNVPECWATYGAIAPPDWPAAKAALDALIAEQDAEWVELTGYWRISTDGIKVQIRDWCDGSDPWVDTTEAPELVTLYRTGLAHGLSVALAEHEALREQVRALVDEVLSIPLPTIAWSDWLGRVREAAKRVQL